MNPCEDCKWRRLAFTGFWVVDYCLHEKARMKDPISGKYHNNTMIERMREFDSDHYCGPLGKWFEQKEE